MPDTLIQFDAQHAITLKNVTLANLQAGDFLFVQGAPAAVLSIPVDLLEFVGLTSVRDDEAETHELFQTDVAKAFVDHQQHVRKVQGVEAEVPAPPDRKTFDSEKLLYVRGARPQAVAPALPNCSGRKIPR